MMAFLVDNIDKNGSLTAIHGTESANIIPCFKNGMIKQPAALSSHFFCEKDERELRASEVSLDSLLKRIASATSRWVMS